ncbi:MAG: hypothetical protein RIG61_07090 [Deltaproteobacteria bacterium]
MFRNILPKTLYGGSVSNGKIAGCLFVILTVLLILSLPADSRPDRDKRADDNDGDEIPFSATEIRIEVNGTDGDAGLQIFLDGEPWKRVRVEGPDGRLVYAVDNLGKLRRLGSTELFMESNEPNFEEELSLPEILELLPEGEYEFEGMTIDGTELDGTATLTHDLPCGPVITMPVEEDTLDPTLPVVIVWEPVTNGLDTTSDEGECDESKEVEIIGYQVIVDNEDSDPLERFDIKLPADAASVTIPPEFIVPGTEYKLEILAIEVSGNQTITESSFFTSE